VDLEVGTTVIKAGKENGVALLPPKDLKSSIHLLGDRNY
jgi:hypothetical protein